jgi:hypothetical protein
MMKRLIWIIASAPAMWGLHHLVCWADRLYAWEYSDKYPPPTAEDFTRAAIVFWASFLIPLVTACVAAIVAFHRKSPSAWLLLESSIIALPYISLFVGMAMGVSGVSPGTPRASEVTESIVWFVMLWACVLVGGAVVAAGHNLGVCIRHRTWGRFAVSVVAIGAGMLYLYWLSAFIIYIDT